MRILSAREAAAFSDIQCSRGLWKIATQIATGPFSTSGYEAVLPRSGGIELSNEYVREGKRRDDQK